MDQLFKPRKRVIPRVAPEDVMAQVRAGSKFIPVSGDLDAVPPGFMIINMKYQGESFRTLVPQAFKIFLGHPGEGDPEDALDEVADLYDDICTFEDGLMQEGELSVQGTNWAMAAQDSYSIYLINRLTRGGKEFDDEVLASLGLNDEFIDQRLQGIAAACLGKTTEEVKESNLGSLLRHVTVQTAETRKLTGNELREVACYMGSHWELRPEYRKRSDVEYDINPYASRHASGDRTSDPYQDGWYRSGDGFGTVTVLERREEFFDANVAGLEAEIETRRKELGIKPTRHMRALTRQYANLKYIAQENSAAQLDITPPEKQGNK